MDKTSISIGELVSIYTDIDTDRFNLGKVIAINDSEVVVASVEPNGIESGLILYCLEDICKIEKKTRYIQKLEKLIKLQGTMLYEPKLLGKNLKDEILKLAKCNNKIICLQIMDSHYMDIVGYINKITNKICEIKQIDESGFEDGFCSVDLEDISSIHYDDFDYRDIEMLYKLNT